MAKGKTIKVRLVSSESDHFYTTTKNPKLGKKLKFKKYDPIVRKHVEYDEKKIK